MPCRDVLVHVTSNQSSGRTLEAAGQLSERFEARITGVHVRPTPVVVPMAPMAGAAPVIEALDEIHNEAANEARGRFEKEAGARGLAFDWHVDDGDAALRIAAHARYADLAVVGQVSPDDAEGGLPSDLAALVALDSGRPVLAVPYTGTFGMHFKRAMICWDASREASRALHDSLRLLDADTAIDVLCVDPDDATDRDPGADITAHLAHHGFKAEAHTMTSAELSVADTILSASADLGSELIVMGAYGHTRFREVVLGGVTRSILHHMPVPVLLSH